jgi:hypothetical protein
MLKTIRVFFLGMREFRSAFTTHISDWRLMSAYDAGRELAHRLTLRHWD